METINIFDEQGESVRQLCGTGIFPEDTNLVLSFGAYQPVPGGSGGLLSILVNGTVVAVWNSANQQGSLVPNGFYQVQVTQFTNPTNPTVIEKAVYIDPIHYQTPIQLSASPNIAGEGTVVVFKSHIQGVPAGPGNEPLRIYTLTGELVKTLPWENGQTSWDMTNLPGQTVASGLYLAVEEATDAVSGDKIHRTVKVLFLK